MNKLLQLSFVIAIFFVVVGGLLFIYSFVASTNGEAQAVNRWCGLAFIVFALIMFYLSTKEDRANTN